MTLQDRLHALTGLLVMLSVIAFVLVLAAAMWLVWGKVILCGAITGAVAGVGALVAQGSDD